MTDLLTLTEAAKRMHTSRSSVFAWIASGYIPAEMIYRLGGRIMFDAGEIDHFIMNQRQAVA